MSQRLKRWESPRRENTKEEVDLQDRDNSKTNTDAAAKAKKAEKKVRAMYSAENTKRGRNINSFPFFLLYVTLPSLPLDIAQRAALTKLGLDYASESVVSPTAGKTVAARFFQ